MNATPDNPDRAAAPEPGREPAANGDSRRPRSDRPKKPLTARRLRRKIWRGFLFTFVFALLGVLVLTRTGVTRTLVLGPIARATGLDLDADSVIVATDLSVIMRGVTVRLPEAEGESAEARRVLAVDRLVARIDWSRLPSPAALAEIELERPRLRVSQSVETGRVNVADLPIFAIGGGSGVSHLPTVVVRNGAVELGEHTAADYTVLAEVPFSGVLAPQPGGAPGRSLFSLNRGVGETGFEVTGMIDERGATVSLGGLVLSDWPIEAIPTRVRDLWAELDLQGRIVPGRITLEPAGGVRIEGELEGVELTLPFLAAPPTADPNLGPPPRLTEVNGNFVVTANSVSADLTGRVDRLVQRVVFDHWGFDPVRSPFAARLTTEPMRLERDLELLDYVPGVVTRHLEMFGRPEADLDATIWIARGTPPPSAPIRLTDSFQTPPPIAEIPPGMTAGDVRLHGVLSIRNGTAAYRGFPYVFGDMSGRFTFTRERLWIDNLRGVAPSGAVLTGGGEIGPLGPTAAVVLDLRVAGIPIDDDLTGAMSAERRAMIDALFSESELAELVDAGLVRSAEEGRALRERLDAISAEREAWVAGGIGEAELRRLDAEEAEVRAELDRVPDFSLGGVADARVYIERLEGEEIRWRRDIRVTMPRVGLLSEHFPVPAYGRDVMLTIQDGLTDFAVESGTTLAGGDVAIHARLDIRGDANAPRVPTVNVRARGVPIDDVLLRAIAGPDSAEPGEGPLRLADLLDRLNLSGKVDSDARIEPDGRSVAYHIDSALQGVSARVEGSGLTMSGIAGSIVVERDLVDLDLTGTLAGRAGTEPVRDARLSAVMTLPPGATWTDGDDETVPTINARVTLPDADAELPIERLVALFDRPTADRLGELRAAYRPAGRLSLEAAVRGVLGPEFVDHADMSVAVTDVRRFSFDLDGMRIDAAGAQGSALVRPGDRPRVDFQGFSVDLTADGVPSGRLTLDDTLPIGEHPRGAAWGLALAGGRFESPTTRWALTRGGNDTFADWAMGYQPRGMFDLDARRREDGAFEGTLRPRSVTLATPRGDAVFTRTAGEVRFGPAGGMMEGISAEGPGVRLSADGNWEPSGAGTRVRVELSADADSLAPPLIGLAPPIIGDVLDALAVESPGGIELTGLDLDLQTGSNGGIASVRSSGAITLADASLNVGVPVTELDGTITFDARRDGPGVAPVYTLSLAAERWRLAGLRMTGGRAEVLSGREPGSVLIPEISASSHGGRFTGSVRLAARPDGTKAYWTDIQLAEVRLAPLLEDVKVREDLTLADKVRRGVAEYLEDDVWDQSADRSRGLVNASLSIAGTVGDDTDRRGRGRVIASGGPVLLLPLLTPLLEVANLQLPVGDELGLALASLYFDGGRMVFEDIAVFSDQIELLGYGEMAWPGAEIDLRFRSQAVARIPVLSTVVETVRDELIATRLTGTLAEPEVRTEPFTATRRVMGSLFGQDDSGQRQLREISRRAGEARSRIREAGEILDRIGAGQVSPTRRRAKDGS